MNYYLLEVKEIFVKEQIYDENEALIEERETEKIEEKIPDSIYLKNRNFFGIIGKNQSGVERYIIKIREEISEEKTKKIEAEDMDALLVEYSIDKNSFYQSYFK